MLKKPDLPDEKIGACLTQEYGLQICRIEFLPLGADANTAVYRALTEDETAWFIKLRSGPFDETSVELPKFLSDQGLAQIIAPVMNKSGALRSSLESYKLILYPFVEGQDGYQVDLSAQHWQSFAAALKSIHSLKLPESLSMRIQGETFSALWRGNLLAFLERARLERFDGPLAKKLAAFLDSHFAEISELVRRTEELAQLLRARAPELVLCHSDLHAGNILIDKNSAFYIVDWDNPILAPKERDLMFIGGGQGFRGQTAEAELDLFYGTYGGAQIDRQALAYYRYERIIEDLAVECEQIFGTHSGAEDRENAYRYFISNFEPGSTLAVARQTDLAVDAHQP